MCRGFERAKVEGDLPSYADAAERSTAQAAKICFALVDQCSRPVAVKPPTRSRGSGVAWAGKCSIGDSSSKSGVYLTQNSSWQRYIIRRLSLISSMVLTISSWMRPSLASRPITFGQDTIPNPSNLRPSKDEAKSIDEMICISDAIGRLSHSQNEIAECLGTSWHRRVRGCGSLIVLCQRQMLPILTDVALLNEKLLPVV